MEIEENSTTGFEPWTYSEILANIKSRHGKKRDPRAIRLAAITCAMMDVVVDVVEKDETLSSPSLPNDSTATTTTAPDLSDTLLATKIYAATVSALERTFFSMPHVKDDDDDKEEEEEDKHKESAVNATSNTSTLDSVATQTALLELLQVTIPFVSFATLIATLNVTSRVLRALITLAHQSMLQQEKARDDDNNNNHPKNSASKQNKKKQKKQETIPLITETNDELGGMNSLLRATIRTSAILLQYIVTSSSTAAASVITTGKNKKMIQQLCHDTLLQFITDRHAKIRKVAQSSMIELLQPQQQQQQSMSVGVLVIHQQVIKLILDQLRQNSSTSNAAKVDNSSNNHNLHVTQQQQQLHFLSFLQQAIRPLLLSTTTRGSTATGSSKMTLSSESSISKIGSSMMDWLLKLLQHPGQQQLDDDDDDVNMIEDYVVSTRHRGNIKADVSATSGSTSRILLIGALLSSLLAMLEDDNEIQVVNEAPENVDEEEEDAVSDQQHLPCAFLNDFAARVLASLIQQHEKSNKLWFASLVVADATTKKSDMEGDDDDILATTTTVTTTTIAATIAYARLITTCCGRVLAHNPQVGLPLLPLSIQIIVPLCQPTTLVADDPHHDEILGVSVAEAIMPELSKLFRTHFITPTIGTTSNANASFKKHVTSSLQVMKQVLRPVYQPTWSVSLKALVTLLATATQRKPIHGFDDEEAVQKQCVEALVQLHTTSSSSDDSEALQSIEQAISSLIESVGLETFWNWTNWQPITGRSGDDNDAGDKATAAIEKKLQVMQVKQRKETNDGIAVNRAWLLPVMKSAASMTRTHRLHLAFFQNQILILARCCDFLAVKLPNDKGYHMARVIDLWSLLGCFCQYPVDVESALPALAQTLVRAMGDTRYPQLVPIISGSLCTLFSGVAERACSNDEDAAECKRDASILAQVSSVVLPAMFKAVESLSCGASTIATGTLKKKMKSNDMDIDDDDDLNVDNTTCNNQAVEAVSNAIAEVAKQSPRAVLQGLFRKLMQRLLEATQSETKETEKICTLLSLARALVASESMDEANTSLLYRACKPLIRSDENESRVQKRAYRVLLEIAQRNRAFITSPDILSELSKLLVDSIMTCKVAARHMRIKCMTAIVNAMDSSNENHLGIIADSVGEVLLCLKDANGKSREAAYQLLLAMAEKQGDMQAFFRLLVAALASETTHMRSAAVTAISRLVFEFARNDFSVQALLPGLLQTILILFDDNSREVTKSTVGFVRVCVAALPPDQLEPMLPELVGGLLKNSKGKDRFRSKIKIILKKLVRLYGYDALTPIIPSTDSRLLTHMRKLSERAARQKAAAKQQHDDHNNASEHTNFDGMIDSDEDDSDDGRTYTSGATRFSQMTGRGGEKSIHSAAKSLAGSGSKSQLSFATGKSKKPEAPVPLLRADGDGEVLDMLSSAVTKNVRFAVDEDDGDDSDADDGMMEFDDMGRLIVPDDEAVATSNLESNDGNNEIDETAPMGKKRRTSNKPESMSHGRKKQANVSTGPGAAYRSKRAGGDVKKKGQKYEPYAYMPLDGKRYTKKNRRRAVEEMSTVVRSGTKRRRS